MKHKFLYLFALFVAAFAFSSCGSTTKATIRNKAEGTSTTVTITTNNPSTITADPDITLTPKNN